MADDSRAAVFRSRRQKMKRAPVMHGSPVLVEIASTLPAALAPPF